MDQSLRERFIETIKESYENGTLNIEALNNKDEMVKRRADETNSLVTQQIFANLLALPIEYQAQLWIQLTGNLLPIIKDKVRARDYDRAFSGIVTIEEALKEIME